MGDPKQNDSDGTPINMTIKLMNVFQKPFFEYEQKLENWPQDKLIYALQAAADVNEHYRWVNGG